MESASVRLPLRVLADKHPWILAEWLVKIGGSVYREQRVAVLKSTTSGAIDHALAPHGGALIKYFVAEGDTVDPSNVPIAEVEFCPHSVVFKGVCAVCGEEAAPAHFAETSAKSEGRLPVAYNSEFLSVTRAEAESVSSVTARRLFESNRLSLVLDLDHTLVHATDDVRASAITHHSPDNVDRSSVVSFTLGPTPDSRLTSLMHLKLRPHLAEFLARVSAKFELHIYTMGSRPYADQVARLIDPDKSLFSGRITSREDFAEGFCNQKSIARLFPCDDSMVLIVDDREDVWISKTGQQYMPNLVRAQPYSFWDGLHEAYDRASSTHEMQALPLNHHPLPNQMNTVLSGIGSVPVESEELSDKSTERSEAKNETREKTDSDDKLHQNNSGDGLKVRVIAGSSSVLNGKEGAKGREGQNTLVSNGKRRQHNKLGTARGLEKPNVPTILEENLTSETKASTGAGTVSFASEASEQKGLAAKDAASADTEHATTTQAHNGDSQEAQGKPVDFSLSRATDQVTSHSTGTPDCVPAFSTELRRIVSGWWEVDSSSQKSEHLLRLAEVLEDCHFNFFNSPDAKGMSKDERPCPSGGSFRAPADVKRILASMRREVLKECVVTFSGVIPIAVDPRTAPEWILAQRLGAKCSAEFVNGYTTHLVTSPHRSAATQKCKEALESDNAFVVTTTWLEDSAFNFERQLELPYSVAVDSRFNSPAEHRRWVEEKFHAAATQRRKRYPPVERESLLEDENASKRRKTNSMFSSDGIGSGAQSPTGGSAALQVLTGDELGAAMEAIFDD